MTRILRMVHDEASGVQPESSPIEPLGVSPRVTPVAHAFSSSTAHRLRIAICLLIAIASPLSAFAQPDNDDDDFLPGLHAKYTANGKTVERLDADVSFDWRSASPDPRLSTAPFTAEWTGKLLIKKNDRYTFHAFVDGSCTLEIDGKEILKGQTRSPKWISGKPAKLRSGERNIRVRFRSTNKTRRIHLFWSADLFPLEPVPANLLFREKPFVKLKQLETGRVSFDVHRCNRCHRRANDPPSLPGPDLTHVVTNLSATELAEKIHDPRHNTPQAKMPTFGFTKDESAAVAAFLRSVSKPVTLPKLPKQRRQKPRRKSKYEVPEPPLSEKRAGEVLVRSVGCLACHTLDKQGNAGPYAGGDLSSVGKKRSAVWLYQWLLDPKKLNAEHRMPVFKLTKQERREIAVFLSSVRSDESKPKRTASVSKRTGTKSAPRSLTVAALQKTKDATFIARGRKLVEQSRCAACHTISGVKFNPAS
ncbi:MAG: c-type cytochrome, partial [Planctomycetes bacterium]|nr:c-type cytochrome [Planctomycetota bacterium]